MDIFDQFGRKRNITHVNAVDRLIALKKKSGNNPWPVIEEIIKIWKATNPTQYKSHLIDISGIRETRKDKKFASTKDPKTGGYLRYTLDIPEKVIFMIRMLYNASELNMDKKFHLEWSKRFPETMVAEKL